MTTTTERFGAPELRYLKRVETALLVAPGLDRPQLLAIAREHLRDRPPAGSWFVNLLVRVDGCEHHDEGSSESFDTATITYRFRGRTRTADLDLGSTYAIVSPPDDACPGRAAAREAGGS